MRFFLLLLIVTQAFGYAFACSSDCYQCHTIPKDRDHEPIKTCTKCHGEHSEEALGGKCGADCFDCHDYRKVSRSSKAHRVLSRCIECHRSIKLKSLPEPLKALLGGSNEGDVNPDY